MNLLAVAAAYVVGAVPIGFLVARAFGVGDLRRHGSGNIGATNVLRTLGRLPAVLTLLGDIAKGYAAVALASSVGGDVPAVTGLRAVSAGHGVIVPASRLAKWKTVTQYVAVTMLILEKGILAPGFHAVATGVLLIAVALTIVSAVDYFYRFFRKADYRAIVPDEERWS